MASLLHAKPNCSIFAQHRVVSFLGISTLPFLQLGNGASPGSARGRLLSRSLQGRDTFNFPRQGSCSMMPKKVSFSIPRSSDPSNSSGSTSDSSDKGKALRIPQTPFGYTRKDVILIGVGLTVLGFGLKSGLEYAGVDPLKAGNVVQLVLVLGLTVGWISTYIFRVGNKEMTYAQQLRDYESKVMEKRLESLSEAELEALMEQVEEEKRRLGES
ncbi:hypothetical protein Tsubulata_040740 [Turnera subulata]|uniref:MAR-binding filament-like protein 1-1 n=1 Tax=Turnera subulata TaxID=218843 RepID=A0A9Q0JIA5_9ROSI|nr:hypothetical protein Tsubulata_040740 [Turnera subulata]